MLAGKLEQLVALIDWSINELGASADLPEVEGMAIMIHRTMTAQARSYHTLDHVFPLAEGASAVRTLAALFHDLVYYQVDKGIPPEIDGLLSPYIEEGGGDALRTRPGKPEDRLYLLTLSLFDLKPGQEISPAAGLNEFLSALYMNLRLGDVLDEKALAKVTVCIEGTIPFRAPDADGASCFERLAERLAEVNQSFDLTMSEIERVEAIQEAVVFANADVGSFAKADPGRFLDDTWLLLPETNAALRSGEVYSIREYRQALQKMNAFLNFLQPNYVFHRYRGVPDDAEYQVLIRLAQRNISTARDYLGVKLLTIAVLEALAEISGGDAPLALFMGDFRQKERPVKRLESYLPAVETPPVESQSPVSRLLGLGRASESIFDLRNSPTSFYLLSALGSEEISRLFPSAEAMFAGEIDTRAFLDQIDGGVVAAIAEAAGKMVSTRRKRLLHYAHLRRQDTPT
jgi:hypothetical protein